MWACQICLLEQPLMKRYYPAGWKCGWKSIYWPENGRIDRLTKNWWKVDLELESTHWHFSRVAKFEFQWKFLLFRHRTQEDSSSKWSNAHSLCLGFFLRSQLHESRFVGYIYVQFITHCNVALCILNAVVPSDEWTSLQIGVRSSD